MSDTTAWLGANYNHYFRDSQRNDMDFNILSSILIVDDDIAMLRSVSDLLEAFGYQCIAAETGRKALDIIDSQPIDLILLDLNMPNVNGYQVLKQLHQTQHPADVIILSGENNFDDAIKVMEFGVRNFLRKPYLPAELLSAINKTADVRRIKHAQQQSKERLQNSTRRQEFIINNSPDVIFMLDTEGCFSFINERAEGMLGYSHDELIGMHFSVLVHPDDFKLAQFAFPERRTGKRATQHVELRLLPKHLIHAEYINDMQPLTIELNSMGIYAGESEKIFIGSYGVIRDISERKRTEQIMNYQLYHDVLTELPNRALFKDRLQLAMAQATRDQSQLAVMYLDMDRFKIINDSLGHLVGDQLLQAVSYKLKNCLRGSDTLARVGGDEFNLLLPNIKNDEDASIIARKILSELEKPIVIDGIELFISFSIGIAIYPRDGQTIDTLIKHADTAMYHVKENGKKNYLFYQTDMQNKHVRHVSLENDLRSALENNQFCIFFQPQVDVTNGNTLAVEALIRWNHPHDGIVLPQSFIELSEETGLITDIGRWLLDEACQTVRSWWEKGNEQISLSINASSRELIQHDFAKYVIDTLNKHNFPGDKLILEVSESVLMKDMEQTLNVLNELTAKGVRIAVDNFGTGYSSLSYLQSLPLDTLKIDRSFIDKIKGREDSSTILYAIVSMAKGLGLDIVAQGVETQIQMDFLKKLGCPKAQGFYISRPKPPEQIEPSLAIASA